MCASVEIFGKVILLPLGSYDDNCLSTIYWEWIIQWDTLPILLRLLGAVVTNKAQMLVV